MKNYKKLLALLLSAAMTAGLTACGGGSGDAPASDNTQAPASDSGEAGADTAQADSGENSLYNEGETRTIRIGTWYDHYYDSTNTDIHDDPSVSDEELAQKHFDVVSI